MILKFQIRKLKENVKTCLKNCLFEAGVASVVLSPARDFNFLAVANKSEIKAIEVEV